MAGTVARRVVVRGLVQGVGFRYWTVREASRLGIVGTVTNRADGSVEAVVEGPAEAVERLVGWFRDGGAPSARVDAVEVADAEPTGASSFDIV
ncbi:acylphosphatase [Frondihabitans sucicola]|uniref:acylphosphatase n=1 Tax=Frondihabitans sucicola TaxID=1268041 RepID=A0ABM8GTP3_9MICO|nr:acylphosphatase [Frondihabitans sucicola]BDZ51832.1 acylphosphatase [Frondihabitans sucicola]